MSTFCFNRNADSVKNLETFVGSEQIGAIAEAVNRDQNILLRVNGKLTPSKLYAAIRKDSNNSTEAINKYLEYFEEGYLMDHNWFRNKAELDTTGEPIYKKDYSHLNDNKLLTAFKSNLEYLKKSITRYNIKLVKNPNNEDLRSIVNKLKKMDFTDYDNDKVATAFNIDYYYNQSKLRELLDKFFGDKGYANADMLALVDDESAINDFTNVMEEFSNFYKNYQLIMSVQKFTHKDLSASEQRLNKAIDELQSLNKDVELINSVYKNLLEDYFEKKLLRYTSNPDIKLSIRNLFDATDDESKAQLLLDSMLDTNVPFIANFMKRFITERTAVVRRTKKQQQEFADEWTKLEAAGFNLDQILDPNEKGKLISEFNDNYLEDHKAFVETLTELQDSGKKYTPEYYEKEKAYNKWKNDNLLSELSDEIRADKLRISDIVNSNIELRKKLDAINEKKRFILSIYDNNFDIFNMREEDVNTLLELNREKTALASDYDSNNNLKNEQDRAIAKSLRDYNKAMLEHIEKYYDSTTHKDFKSNLEKAISENDQSWIARNSKKTMNDSFYKDLEDSFKIMEYEKEEDSLKEVVKRWRDDDGIVDGRIVPKEIAGKIKEKHEARYADYYTEQQEDRIPKGISAPRKNYVVTQEYLDKLLKRGVNTKEGNKFIQANVAAIKKLLKPYAVDGSVNYAEISKKDLSILIRHMDEIDFHSTVFSKDMLRQEFDKWFAENHKQILDKEAFERDRKIAESKGEAYYEKWLEATTEFRFTDRFRDDIQKLKEEVYPAIAADEEIRANKKNKKKTNTKYKVYNINYNALRRLYYQVESYAQLPNNIRAAINKKEAASNNSNGYTLSAMISNYLTNATNLDMSKQEVVDKLAKLRESYNDKMKKESKDGTLIHQRYMFRQDYNAMFKSEETARYKELAAKPENKEGSKWYLDNHTINDKGEVVPINFWLIKTPINDSYYDANAPKQKIYGYSELTNDSYKDPVKSEARAWINENTVSEPTEYYKRTLAENRQTMSKEDFAKWFDDNHVENPYTGKFEPINIWTNFTSNSNAYINEYTPKSHLTNLEVKDEYTNKSETDPYRAIYGRPLPKKDSKYYNKNFDKVSKNPLYQLIKNTMDKSIAHYDRETRINHGWMPTVRDRKLDFAYMKQSFGWFDRNTDEIIGENNEIVRMLTIPMMNKLSKQDLLSLPKRSDYTTDAEFETALKEVKDKNKEIKKLNDEFHNANINTDFKTIIQLFMSAANDHKFKSEFESEFKLAIEQAKQLDFFNKKTLNTRYKSTFASNKLDEVGLDSDHTFSTKKGEDSNAVKHLEMFMKMIFYNEFEKNEGNFTKVARVIQNYTSAKGMWLNASGAFNNIAFGKIQMALERFSGYFYSNNDRMHAEKEYWNGAMHMIANMGNEKSTNINEAILKYFDIVESQDEVAITHNPYLDREIRKNLISISSFYIMHHLGEHYMQSAALLAMMRSHRLVGNEFMSINDYKYKVRYDAIKEALGDNSSDFDTFIEANKMKDKYLDGRGDIIRDYILQSSKDIQMSYLGHFESISKKLEDEFKNFKTVRELVSLENGYMQYAEGVPEYAMDAFKSKVLRVNEKIHGIYSKVGANTMQHVALGRMAMHFRKWMRPNWNKRFGTKFGKSFWNEARSEMDKGFYVTTFEFLFKPILDNVTSDIIKNDNEITAGKAFMNILHDYGKYISNAKVYWNSLSTGDKANVKRMITEMIYLNAIVLLTSLVRGLGDDDDELRNSKRYAYALYSLDRMRSEIKTYDPLWGWHNESRKLMRDPFAAMSTIEGGLRLFKTIIFEHDAEYEGGIYSKESKLKVELMRNIPLFNRYLRYQNIEKFAGYYKLY